MNVTKEPTKPSADENRREALRALFPGRTIALDDRVDAQVFPLGVPQLRRFTDRLVQPFADLMRAQEALRSVEGPERQTKIGAAVLGRMVPMVASSMVDILDECVRVSVERPEDPAVRERVMVSELPHHFLPPIAEAWIQESFGDAKKLEPWLNLLKTGWKAATGETMEASEIWSRFVSKEGTPEPTSST